MAQIITSSTKTTRSSRLQHHRASRNTVHRSNNYNYNNNEDTNNYDDSHVHKGFIKGFDHHRDAGPSRHKIDIVAPLEQKSIQKEWPLHSRVQEYIIPAQTFNLPIEYSISTYRGLHHLTTLTGTNGSF